MRHHRPLSVAIVATIVATAPLSAQRPRASADTIAQRSAFPSLRWRNIGPFRGGRSVAVAGSYVDRQVFYFGAVDGGVWKTTNGGMTWRNISDFRVVSGGPDTPALRAGVRDAPTLATRVRGDALRDEIASVGAIAVAPSDPNVIWVGTGESGLREDLTYGTGIYRSSDGGETWVHRGLGDSRQIGAIRVSPTDPDVAYVAAIGHAFGPNRTRGVYRTTDGGSTWKQLLFVDDSTGAIDLSMNPRNPRELYAAMWHLRRFPWGMRSGGGNSGLYKSTDGGDTWTDISANEGLPHTALGRIGVAISPANPRRVYATVEAPDSSGVPRGGIFRSDDAGRTWTRTSGDQRWQVRAWYYSTITADPQDENTVYVNNLGTWKSIDGGKSWTRIRVPHGDTHLLWIDPKDPQRMIHANDGGATVSFDGGASWSPEDNQPTAQFYHVITDDRFPYRVYGAQQDNTTVSIASRSDNGVITREDWYPAAGGESAYIAVDPKDPDITYGGGYMGEIWRQDKHTNRESNVAVWLDNYDGWAAKDVPYRFAWTFPLFFSQHDSTTLYTAAQYLFKSTNAGQSWTKISPDLSRADPRTLQRSGGPIHGDMTGTEWYAMAFAVAESPVEKGLIWAGSDDGLVHVTRDGGATWIQVTPQGLGPFTKMNIVEPGRFDAGTAYIAANRYQQDDFAPYFLKTHDYGRTWTRIDAGIPMGAYARVIREDPVRRGLLYAGTETGVYVSFDDGAHWQSLQLNLPRVSVRDLVVKDNDLVIATHGRAFWILDDVSPLRQVTDSVRAATAHLFAPAVAVRFQAGRSRPSLTAGQNPFNGVYVDYWLKQKPSGQVKLEFVDAAGKVIRTFTSDEDETPKRDTTRIAYTASDSLKAFTAYDTTGQSSQRKRIEGDSVSYEPADSIVTTRAGLNRFVWNLRAGGVREIKDIVNDEGVTDGPMVVPGRYTARLTVNERTLSQPFTVIDDPRVHATQAELVATYDLASRTVAKINDITNAAERIGKLQSQLSATASKAKGAAYAKRVDSAATSLKGRLEAIRAQLADVHSEADQITLHYPVRPYNQLLNVNRMAQSFERGPTEQAGKIFDALAGQVDALIAKERAIESQDIQAFNAMLRSLDVPAIPVEVARPIS